MILLVDVLYRNQVQYWKVFLALAGEIATAEANLAFPV